MCLIILLCGSFVYLFWMSAISFGFDYNIFTPVIHLYLWPSTGKYIWTTCKDNMRPRIMLSLFKLIYHPVDGLMMLFGPGHLNSIDDWNDFRLNFGTCKDRSNSASSWL